jgi:transposase
MALGRPKARLVVAPSERERLLAWARRPKTAQALALRARIVLKCAEGLDNIDVAEELRVTPQTVGRWRRRFLERRLAGLLDEPRPGAPRRISDAEIERVIVKTLESKPRDATHWSTRSMAQASGLSQSTISRVWRAFALQPHRSETFKLSKDPLFIEKVRDVVGLYLNPPDKALVLCVDEKSQIQALDRTQPLLPMRPGTRGARRTPDPRQLRDPQDAFDSPLARAASALPSPLHADGLIVAEPRRALVRHPHREADPAGRSPQHPRARDRHPAVPRGLQRGPEALRLDPDGRSDPRLRRSLL